MKEKNMVWIDMEMTGLDPERDTVLEIASIVTDKDLNILEEGPTHVINHPQSLFATMDDWNQKHHTKSGLWQMVQASSTTISEAEKETLDFIKKFTAERKNPLCGNSIGQDRLFLSKYMPSITSHLHYRIIDVSSIKELAERWYPDQLRPPTKKGNHRALDDIRESIEELKYYRKELFK